MLQVSNIHKNYGSGNVLDAVSFTLGRGERVGLVGQNGSGKSTLLKIICGAEEADAGSIRLCGNIQLAYLPQQLTEHAEQTVGQFLAAEAYGALLSLREIEILLSREPDNAELGVRYAGAVEQFEARGGYLMEAKIENTLSGLCMSDISLERRLGSLSGGQRTRLALARVLLLDADILLLDEPTNNLDVAALEWLEDALLQSRTSLIVVSHDRKFLDRITNKTVELDRLSGKLTEYGGNYSLYRQLKSASEARQWRQYREQQERVHKLTADIRQVKQRAMKTEMITQNDFSRGRSKKVAALAKSRESRLGRMISEDNRIEKPRGEEAMRLRFNRQRSHRVKLLGAKDVWLARENATILSAVNLEVYSDARIALTGGNGSGKSTLLDFLSGLLAHQRGEFFQRPAMNFGYLSQHQDTLPEHESVLDFFMSADHQLSDSSSRTFLHAFLFSGDEVFKTIANLSRGERTRLILATFMAREPDLLILDEPTNHLDVRTLECLERALKEYQGALIVVSHDRFFLEELKIDTFWKAENRQITAVLMDR